MNHLVFWCALLSAAAVAGGAQPAPAPALFRSRSTFDVQSTLLLSELADKHRDVGYRLSGALTLQPVAVDPDQHRLLLELRLQGVQLQLRGARRGAEYAPRGSLWDEVGGEAGGEAGQGGAGGAFYALLRAGRLEGARLDAREPRDVLNYKRALLSLFQFQLVDGEYKETDISGECDATYETLSPTVFRKTKRRCAFEAQAEGGAGGVRARRVSRYTLSEARDALHQLHAEEVVWLALGAGAGGGGGGGGGEDEVGVKARSWHTLALRSAAEATPAVGGAALDAALAALPAALQDTPLPLPLADDDDDDEEESLESAVEAHGAALEGEAAGEGGARAQAAALAPLLRALRAAREPALRALLHRPALQARLPGLCRALGLAGTRAAWHAARALLAPAKSDALESLTLRYLEGLALSDRPQEETAAEVLALGEEASLPSIAEAALLAGAAAAARGAEPARARARDRLARGLARAAGAARAGRLRALGNLRRGDAAPALLAAAEAAPRDAEPALAALRAAPARALDAARLERAALLAGNASLPLAARALALELAAERLCAEGGGAVPVPLLRLAVALLRERGARAHELRRALWQRLAALEEAGGAGRAGARALRRVLPPELASWGARAHAGTTSVLRRALGWRGGGWRGALQSAQLAAQGLLRRGRVVLRAETEGEGEGRRVDLLAVEVWTRGLDAIAGGGGGDEEEQEAEAEEQEEGEGGPAAGLRLEVGGVALPPAPLFAGRAELLAHIWAGTGAEPTRVLRALLPLGETRARVPLQAGAALALAAHAAGALALDAAGAVSLWHRTASARLQLRVALHAGARAAVRTRWSELRARAWAAGAAALRVAPDLEFADELALCVRAAVAPHEEERGAELRSRGGARAWRVRRARTARVSRAGLTLALGRRSDAACRARAADDDE